jgi:hypothetical protein
MTTALWALALLATLEVPAGGSLAEAAARARPGDSLRLAAGTYRESLRAPAGLAIAGAGPERTVLEPPEGEDGIRAAGPLSLSGLTVRAGPARCALKVDGGEVRLREVVLDGGSCGLFLGAGRVDGSEVELRGGMYGLLQRDGSASLTGGSIHGGISGAGMLHGQLSLSRVILFGPSASAALTVADGSVRLEAVVVVAPGPSGLSASYGGRITGSGVSVSGASEQGGVLGACVQSLKGAIHLSGSELLGCAGAALEASGGTVVLDGVEAEGGSAGCLVLLDGAQAELQGNRCTGRGPGLVAASGSTATARWNRWRTDPALYVECATGARVRLLAGEEVREPCPPAGGATVAPPSASPPRP